MAAKIVLDYCIAHVTPEAIFIFIRMVGRFISDRFLAHIPLEHLSSIYLCWILGHLVRVHFLSACLPMVDTCSFLITALKNCKAAAYVVSCVCSIITIMAMQNKNAANLLRGENGSNINILLECIDSHSQNVDTLTKICYALAALCFDKDSSGDEYSATLNTITTKLLNTVDILDTHPHSESLISSCCWVFTQTVVVNSSTKHIIDRSLPTRLLKWIKQHMANAALVRLALGTLSEMLSDSTIANSLNADDSVQNLMLEVISVHGGDSSTMLWATSVLKRLAPDRLC